MKSDWVFCDALKIPIRALMGALSGKESKSFSESILESRLERLENQNGELKCRLEVEIVRKNEIKFKADTLDRKVKLLEEQAARLQSELSESKKRAALLDQTLSEERQKASKAVTEVQKNSGQLRVITKSLEAERFKAAMDAQNQKERADQALTQVKGEMEKAVIASQNAETASKAARDALKTAEAEKKRAAELAEKEKSQAEILRKSVQEILALMEYAAKGDLTRRFTSCPEGAMGDVMRGLNLFFDQIQGSLKSISQSTSDVVLVSSRLFDISKQMREAAQNSVSRVEVVTGAASKMGENVQKVESVVQGMAQGIVRVSDETARASQIAGAAVESSTKTAEVISKLSSACQDIKEVSRFISDIARKTKMLAMNAKIEAALAGEKGAGFGVVAEEMKSMASETEDATLKIDHTLRAIISSSESGSASMQEISEVIKSVRQISELVSETVGKYRADAESMSAQILEVTGAAKTISQSIHEIKQGAEGALSASERTAEQVQVLNSSSEQSSEHVKKFRIVS